MHGNSTRENRETPRIPATEQAAGREAKAVRRNAAMNVTGESDGRVVPTKDPNNGVLVAPAEGLEGRRPTTENIERQVLVPDSAPDMGESRRLLGVRKVARQDKGVRFTALLHHVTVAQLTASFFALKRSASPGVDGITWEAYATNLDARVKELHARVHRGTYQAQPSKRAYIPKADGRLRPLGIAALEFGRFAARQRKTRGDGKPETFDFLGFTHICGKTRTNGRFIVLRRTVKKRLRAKLQELKAALRVRRHDPIPEVGRWLRRVVDGYFNYHAVPLNGVSLTRFRIQVVRLWFRELRRRGQRHRITWFRFARHAAIWIPQPSIRHPYPSERFAAKHPR